MSTSNEKAAIQEVLKHYRELKQAAADAQFWHDKYQEEIKATYESEIARIEAEYEQSVGKAQAEFEGRHLAAVNAAAQAIAALGILAADWNSELWKLFDPSLRQMSSKAPDPLTGMPIEAGGFGSIEAVPGGVRIGTINQKDLEKPILDAPALVPLTGQRHVLIVSQGGAKNQALRLLQSIVTRVAVTFPVLSARFVFIDPLGLGDDFPFKELPESIRGATVFSEADEIRQQMRELTEHLRRVTLRYLAREFDNIEAYNKAAEEVVEPYRFLCIADFPAKFDSDAATRLLAVAERGVRTGVYVLMHVNADVSMPREFDFEALKRTATVITATPDGFTFPLDGEQYPFAPDDIPDSNLFNNLLRAVNEESKRGVFQGIAFEKIASRIGPWWSGDSREVIDVPIGRTGARDDLNFWLGRKSESGIEKISAHALIGGRTGSGKTNLFHALINSLALKYSPDELELYLLDFKEGVAFSVYADYGLPHAQVIAIESEREFGLSVLRRLSAEMEQRGDLFKETTKAAGRNIEDVTEYRNFTGKNLSRVVLIIDEFQVIFAEQDALANRAAQILEDLARRGRSFGVHVILGSQSIKVANLSSAIYGQFATRIALQSPEQDIAVLLAPDNVDEAALLERPGEIIYNDSGGRRGHNNSGQVAVLRNNAIPSILNHVNALAGERKYSRGNPLIVFRGNQGSNLQDNLWLQQLYDLTDWPTVRSVKDLFQLREWIAAEQPSMAWLGEAVEIKPHTSAPFRRQGRSNLLIVGDNEEIIFGMLGGAYISLAAFFRPQEVRFRIADLSLKEEAWEDICENFQMHFAFHDVKVEERRGATRIIDEVSQMVKERQELYDAHEDDTGPTIFLIVAGMHRLSEFRPVPSRLGMRDEPSEYAKKLTEILQRGPALGIYTIVWCDNAKNFDSILGRPVLAQFDRRVALRMSADDSQLLLKDTIASKLPPYRAILVDDEHSLAPEKFKPYVMPSNKQDCEELFRGYAERLSRRLEDHE